MLCCVMLCYDRKYVILCPVIPRYDMLCYERYDMLCYER
jgi:hypothetical protein